MGRSVFVSCFVKTARVQLRHSRIGFVRAEGERIPIHLNCPTHRRSSFVVRRSSFVVAGRHGPQSAPGRLNPVPRTAIALQDDALGQVQVRRCCGRVIAARPRSIRPPRSSLVRSLVRSFVLRVLGVGASVYATRRWIRIRRESGSRGSGRGRRAAWSTMKPRVVGVWTIGALLGWLVGSGGCAAGVSSPHPPDPPLTHAITHSPT